jgi:hypothetical protein
MYTVYVYVIEIFGSWSFHINVEMC